ncbi:SDR family oxidoreductase [Streptomyces sp. NPDC060054]|uniref:SDR family oxidoreductase n=1 Tax=unclassified Streptomyces TaxID=2593676 RepID=UPI0036878A69
MPVTGGRQRPARRPRHGGRRAGHQVVLGARRTDRLADLAKWNRMIDVNLRGVLHGIAAVLPIMRAQHSGHIVNISSVSGPRADPRMRRAMDTSATTATAGRGRTRPWWRCRTRGCRARRAPARSRSA